MVIILALYAFGGLAIAGLSVPLILGKIRPNSMFGLRARNAADDPRLWYKVNAYAGQRFLVVGLGTSAGAIILYYTTLSNVERYALSCLGVFLALFLWGVFTSFLYSRSFHK